MESPLIAIIIPVHNTEQYITDCLESVLRQSYKSTEIIIVDDDSTDRSAEIIKAYKKEHRNIVYVKTKNGNAAKTRRDGIEKAKASLVCFVDADDVVDKKYVERLYKAMEATKTSISACRIETFTTKFQRVMNPEKTKPYIIESNASTFADHYHITDKNKLVLQTLPCKLFKKELFKDLDYSVLITNIFEDNFIMAQVLSRVDEIGVVDETLYGYRQTANTTSRDTLTKKVEYNGTTLNFVEFFKDVVMEYCRKTLKGPDTDAAIDRLCAAEFFNYARMVPDLKVNNDYLEQKVSLIESYLEGRDAQIDAILNSRSYKVGHAIVGPASKIVNTIKRRV